MHEIAKKCPDRKTKCMGHVYFAMLPDLTYPGICCRLTNTNRRSSTLLLSTRTNVRGAVGQIVGRDGQGRHLGGRGADPTILRLGKSIFDERKADSAIAAAGERSRDGRGPVGGLQFLHPSRGDHQVMYRGREIKTGTQGRSEQPN